MTHLGAKSATHIMHQHTLNPVFQRHRTRITRPTSTPQLQQHMPVLKPPELDIPTILLYSWPYPCVEQFLDHSHDLAIVLVILQRILLAAFLPRIRISVFHSVHDYFARRHGFGD